MDVLCLPGLSGRDAAVHARAWPAVGAPGHRRRRPARRPAARDRPSTRWPTTSQIASWADEDARSRTVLDRAAGHATSTWSSRCGSRRAAGGPSARGASARPGLTVEQTVPFRDKELMKEVLDAAGIRMPRAVRSTTVAGVRDAAEQIGFPLIVKPIAGAGSLDTYRVDDRRRARRRPPASPPHPRGQRRGVHRRRGVHLRHRLAPAAGSPSTTSASTGPGRWSASRSSGSAQQVIALRDLGRPDAGRRAGDG